MSTLYFILTQLGVAGVGAIITGALLIVHESIQILRRGREDAK
ncbi:hypothetical protein [Streptomyces sulphureus]|nr:hypothetical protein [Streptomyces sulphureus]